MLIELLMTIHINLLERGKNMEGLTRTHHFMMILKESDLLRREIERKLTPETAAEYNKITAVRNSAFVELLKSNMPYTDTGKVIRITIDDENFDISKKSLHRFVGEDNFNLLLEDKENPVESKAPEISSIESGDFNFRNMQLKKDESVADSIARLEKESQGEMQQIPSIDEIKNTVQKSMHDAMGDLMKSVLSELASAQQTGNTVNKDNTPNAQEVVPQDSTMNDTIPCTHTVTPLDSDSVCDNVCDSGNKGANESVNESANKCVNESAKECDTLCDTLATASANTEIAESITEAENNKQIDAENNEQAIAQDNNIDSKSIEPETALEDVTQPAAPNDETHNIIVEMPNEERAVENIIPANDKETKTEEVVDKKDITPSQNAAEASVPFETGSNAPTPESDMEIMFSSDTIPNSKETTQIADHDETLSDVNDEIEAMPIEQQPHPALNTESIPTPELEPILSKTYGAIVYQEQVMEILQKLAGYSLGAADQVRRYMSKKKVAKMEAERQVFIYGSEEKNIPGCVKNGISAEIGNQIYDKMIDFAKYAFNKSHAAAYATNSYYTGWFKYYYPADFLSAAMNWAKNEKIPGLMGEAISFGVNIIPPDINRSETKFVCTGNREILFGFSGIKFVANEAETIVKERNTNGKYVSVSDFLIRTTAKKNVVENLIFSGSFDSFGSNRHAIVSIVEPMKKTIKKMSEKEKVLETLDDKKKLENAKKSYEAARVTLNSITIPVYKEDRDARMAKEKELLGAYVTESPLDQYPEPEKVGCTAIGNFNLRCF